MSQSILALNPRVPSDVRTEHGIDLKVRHGSELHGCFAGVHLQVYLLEGSVTVDVRSRSIVCAAPAVVDLLPFSEVCFSDATSDAHAIVLITPVRASGHLFKMSPSMPVEYVMKLGSNPVITVTREEMAHLRHRLDLLQDALRESDHHYREEMVSAAFTLLERDVANVFLNHSREVQDEVGTVRSREIFSRFAELVNSNLLMHHDVAFYASALCITPQYLSRVVRSIVFISPKSYIDYMLMGELREWVARSTLSLQEVAIRCGFADQGVMTKFFRRHMGMTPTAFRLMSRNVAG